MLRFDRFESQRRFKENLTHLSDFKIEHNTVVSSAASRGSPLNNVTHETIFSDLFKLNIMFKPYYQKSYKNPTQGYRTPIRR